MCPALLNQCPYGITDWKRRINSRAGWSLSTEYVSDDCPLRFACECDASGDDLKIVNRLRGEMKSNSWCGIISALTSYNVIPTAYTSDSREIGCSGRSQSKSSGAMIRE